jgi:hypothetical protein
MGSFSLKGLLNGIARDIATTNQNALITEINGANVSAFGDLVTVGQEPLIQGDFVGSTINTQIWTPTSSGTGASIGTDSGRAKLICGTIASTGNAKLLSVRPARYRAGQAITARFTPSWAGTAANHYDIYGMGMTDATVSSGTGGTWWVAGTASDGYFIGYAGTSFGIMHRNSAGSSTVANETFTAQASWNVDVCDGTGPSGFNWSDKSKAYPIMLRYPYLGHGDVEWFIQDPNTARWILFHVIKYAGSSALPQLKNPSLEFFGHNYNLSGTTSVTSYVTCVGVFQNGPVGWTGAQFSKDWTKTTITTETNILSIRNATSYNGVTNQGSIRIRSLSVAASLGNTVGTMRAIVGTTLGGSPAFAALNGTTADSGVTITAGQSMASTDTAGTTISGGVVKFGTGVGVSGNAFFDMTPFNLFIYPGETMTFSYVTTNASSVVISVNWNEDV